MRGLVVVLCTGAAACAQLAGIDQTRGGGGDGGGDATPPGSSLAFDRYSIGATIVQAPLAVAGLDAPTFFIGSTPAGGAPVTGVVSGSNSWSTDQTASSVLFHLPDVPASIPRMFAFPNPAVKSLFAVLERPGALPPPAGATVDIDLTLDAAVVAGDGAELLDVGAWSVIGFALAVGQLQITAPATGYASWGSLTGRPLDSIGVGDAILGLHYTGNQLSGEVDLPGFAQTGSDAIRATLVHLDPGLTLSANVTPGSGATRLAAAVPASPNPPAVVWSLTAAPGYAIGSVSGVQLNAAAAPVTDLTVNATYANPFAQPRDWHTVFEWVIHADRTYTPTTGVLANQVIGLTAQLFTLREPGDGTAPDNATLDAGMPLTATLGATALTTDGQVVADDPTTPLTVTFTADTPSNTLYQVQVLETALAADNVTQTLTDIFAYSGAAPSVTLPANTLVAGHTYRLRVVCVQGGFPTIATGDLSNRALPISFGLLDSAVFSVGAPQ